MNDNDIRVFVENYLREMRDTSRDGIEFWDQLDQWIDHDPERAWRILVQLSKSAVTGEAHILGTGPLEQFLVTHDEFARRAVEEARANETFKSMLFYVTPTGMSAEMEELIRGAVE
jgi:hypothetical protein